MGFLDILRKLGILRFGATAAVYRDAASRPTEFTDDGVFNAAKDLAVDKPVSSQSGTSDRPDQKTR